MKELPLFRGQSRVQSCQSPQHHNLITKGRACMLRCVTVAVDSAVFSSTMARAAIVQCHLGVEPPNQNLKKVSNVKCQ
jgi:hypothetical protein